MFTNTDWNIAQTVSVNGVTDGVVDDTQSYMIAVSVATGSDASHSDVVPQQLSGQVTDVDVASFTLTPFGGAVTLAAIAEGENTTTFTVVLGAEPLTNVVFDVNALGTDVTVSPNSLTFIPSGWNSEQTVTVTSRIDNNDLDGDAAYTVTVSVDVGASDNAFDLPDQTLNGMVTDDDVAGFTLAPAGGGSTLAAISESDSTTFTARLNRGPQTNVTLSITSTDPDEATVSVSTLVFSSITWDTAQTVSVDGVADSVVDGTQNYVIAVAVATGSDASYSSVVAQQLRGQVTDAEVASFTLTPFGDAATLAAIVEGENTTTFAVVLGARPLDTVVFDVSKTGDDVTVSPTRLTFAPGTWNTAQNVNVTSRIENNVLDGDAAYTVTVSVDDDASDNFFDPLPDQTLTGMVTDDDVAGFTLVPAGGSTLAAISESGSTTFMARLNRGPLTNVTLSITSTDTGEATVSVPTLVFTNTDWNIAQTVSVNGVTDGVVDDTQSYMIAVSVATSSAASYSSVGAQQLSGEVTDVDVASFTLVPSDGSLLSSLAEGNNTLTFTVVLGAEPLSNVVFDVSALGTDVTVSPNSLTFIPSGWNSEQTVTVTSRIDNNDLDGDAAYTVTVSVDVGASDNAFDLPDQTLNGMVTDDDVAGFTLAPAGGGSTLAAISESDSTTFTARLNRGPQTNVTLSITSTDPDEATVSVSTLVFSSITWDTAQTVSVDGAADNVVDGIQSYMISVAVVTADSDTSYSGVGAQQLRGQVTDVDVASFTLTPFGGAATLAAIVEGENTTTFAVVLGARPLDTVVFDVSKTGDDVTVSPTRLTFAPGTWNTAQNVNVTSRIENNVLDGDAAYTVTVSVDDDASDNFFDPLPDQTLTGMVTDDDVAGFTLVPAGGSTLAAISESGSTTFMARLNRGPLTNVTLSITSSDPGEATVLVPTLVFTNTDWNIAQTVSVNGVTDGVVDDTQNYMISIAVATGSAASYNSVGAQQLSGQVTDVDVASFMLVPSAGSSLSNLAEGSNTLTFTVVLGAEPLSDVVFDVSALGTDVTVSPDSLTFIPSGWNSEQTVTVTSRIDNDDLDGDAAYTVTVSVDVGASDNAFDLPDQTLNGMVTDDDVAGFTLAPVGGSTLAAISESGSTSATTTTFTARLNRAPLTNVTLAVSSTDTGEATVSVPTLVFSSITWDTAQTVSVNGVIDGVVDDTQSYMISVAVITADSDTSYSGVVAQQLRGQVTDVDVASFTLTPFGGAATLAAIAEGENTTTFAVVLDAQPLGAVVFDVSTTGTDVTVSPTRLTFAPGTWNTAQNVNVTSRTDNNVLDGDAAYTVTVSVDDGASAEAFDDLLDQTLTGMVTDDDVAGFTLVPAGGSTLASISESGSTTFTARLNRGPQTNVTLSITSTDPDEAIVSVSTLVFTNTDWNIAQTVSVNGVTDGVVDDTQSYMISVTVATGSDASYSGGVVAPQQLSGQVTDVDVASFMLVPSAGSSLSNLTEGSNTLTFTVVLSAEPLSNVVFDVSALGTDVTVSPNSLTFIPSGWNSEQTVTVTSRVDNDDLDGDAAYTVTVSVNEGSSADAFDLLPDQTLNGMVTDDDVAGFTLAPAGGAATLAAISESGSTTFTARLNRGPQTNVTLSITSIDPDEATVSVSTLVFSSITWNTGQTVSVNGVADSVVDGIQSYMISVAVVTADSDTSYSGVGAQQLRGQVTDVDVASFTLDPDPSAGSSLSSLAEGSNTLTFTVVLDAQPLSAVVFDVSTTGDDVTVSPNSLTFTPGNWNRAQSVTVTSRVDNNNLEAAANYIVTVAVNDGASATAFNGLPAQMLSGTVSDNDTASFTLAPSDGSSLPDLAEVEGSSTQTFTVVLDKIPTSAVVFDVSKTGPDVTVSPARLTFAPGTWNTAQTVTVTSRADNNVVDGAAAYTVTVSVNAGASDSDFDGLDDQTLNGMVTDDDIAGFTISVPNIDITEGDPDGESFTITLDTQPTGNVTLAVSSSSITLATVTPGMLIFTMDNWSTAQMVFVTTDTIDDEEPGDDLPFTITIVVTSADLDYAGLEDTMIPGQVVDNDGLGEEETTQIKTAIAIADSLGTAHIATDLITARLQHPPVLQPTAQLAGKNLVPSAVAGQLFKVQEVDPWQDEQEPAWSGDFEDLLPGTNFVLPLSDAAASGAHTELWGSVGYIDFKGDPTIDNVSIDYDGQVTGVHVGIGRQYANGTNFGVSVGSTKVKIDLSGTGVEKVERDVVSIHPYIGWSLTDRVRAWLIAGYGDGDYILELENEKIETKASLKMLAGGLQRSGTLGTFDTTLRLEGVTTRSELEGVKDQNLVAEVGSAWFLRTEFEISRTYASDSGSLIQSFGAVSYRFDGGDLGSSGAGEISLGLRSQFDDAWLADFQGRVQVTEADHERHSVQGYLKYDRSNDRRGLLFSASHSVEYENQDDAVERTDLFTSELGYGWSRVLFNQRGIVDIHLRNEYGDEASGLLLGIGYTTQSLQLGLDGSADEVKTYLNYVNNF